MYYSTFHRRLLLLPVAVFVYHSLWFISLNLLCVALHECCTYFKFWPPVTLPEAVALCKIHQMSHNILKIA